MSNPNNDDHLADLQPAEIKKHKQTPQVAACAEPKIEDVLRVEGVKCKGYGIIPKAVTTDRDLSTNAIAIYAYFRSLSGKGDSAFPSRGKILSDIQISKDSYYKGLAELTSSGYVVISRKRYEGQHSGFMNNIYTITARPEKYSDISKAAPRDIEKYQAVMQYGLDAALGYGMIPYAVMSDPRLKATPKAVYAYIASYTGAQGYADLSSTLIQQTLNMSEHALQRHIRQLRSYNYLNMARLHIDGKLAKNRYTLNETPDIQLAQTSIEIQQVSISIPQGTNNQDVQKQDIRGQGSNNQDVQKQDIRGQGSNNQDVQKQDIREQDGHFQDVHFQDVRFQDAQKQDTIINSSTINSIIINSSLIDRLIRSVQEKIEFPILEFTYSAPEERAALHTLVNAVAEVLVSTNPRIKVNGQILLPNYVKETLLSINNTAVYNVMERYLAQADKVANPKSYLLTSIFNELRNPTPMEEADEG